MEGRKHRTYDQTILILKQSHLSLSYPILTLTLHNTFSTISVQS
jgi:hypothetical protein